MVVKSLLHLKMESGSREKLWGQWRFHEMQEVKERRRRRRMKVLTSSQNDVCMSLSALRISNYERKPVHPQNWAPNAAFKSCGTNDLLIWRHLLEQQCKPYRTQWSLDLPTDGHWRCFISECSFMFPTRSCRHTTQRVQSRKHHILQWEITSTFYCF